MKMNKKRLFAAVGSLGMAALLATSSIAQEAEGGQRPEGDRPRGERVDGDRPRGERDGERPRGDRPDGDRARGERRDGDRPAGGPPGMRPEPSAVAQMMLGRFDKDGDKKLDTAELTAALTEMRSQVGPGGPGFGGPGGGGPGGPGGAQMAAQMLERNDTDKDGKLTGDEIPERMRQGMARVDTNNDKSIDRAELERMMSNMGRDRGPRDGQPGEGDRPPRRPAAEE